MMNTQKRTQKPSATAEKIAQHTPQTSIKWAQIAGERQNAIETLQGELDHVKAQRDELLEALRGILAAYKAVRSKPFRIVALVEAAEAAIAKVEGGQQS